jgi:uncharacterized protein YjbI with pentapeptide repeats
VAEVQAKSPRRTRKAGRARSRTQSEPNLATKLKTTAADPGEVRRALDNAAATCRNLWLAFLSLGTYLAISVGSVTHRDLLLESPIKLPLFNVELPLVAFFFVAPLLFVIFHAYLLLNLKLLADTLERYDNLVKSARPSHSPEQETDEEGQFRLLLSNFAFVQLAAGPAKGRSGWTGWLLKFIVWASVVIGPVVLLLLTQLVFLPYHDGWVTWWHRGLLIFDLVLLWVFWPQITLSSSRGTWTTGGRMVGMTVGVVTIVFSVLIASFPGELQNWDTNPVYAWIFLGDVNDVSGKRASLWSNTLVVPDQDFVDDEKLSRGNRIVSLRNRDLSGAVLDRADLKEADFSGADLRGASLRNAQLDRALLHGTDLRRATLRKAKLTSAELAEAKLQEADLSEAHLEGASFALAHFELAKLRKAHLEGSRALDYTDFEGADLSGADLRATDLMRTRFWAADLKNTQFQGARLRYVNFSGADLSASNFNGARFDMVVMWRTSRSQASACFAHHTPGSTVYRRVIIDRPGRAPIQFTDRILDALLDKLSPALSRAGQADFRQRLNRLRSSDTYADREGRVRDDWEEILDKNCTGNRLEELRRIGCSSTASVHVFRGLISNGSFGSADAEPIANAFSDVASCPGAVGLTDDDETDFYRQVSDF